jgi:hypothetical protein
MFTIKFDEAIISDSEMDNFYTTGPGKRGFVGILAPTIYHSNGHACAYLAFPGGVVCYVEKATISLNSANSRFFNIAYHTSRKS